MTATNTGMGGGHPHYPKTDGWKSKVFIGEEMILVKREMDRLRREVRDLTDENYRLKAELSAGSEPQLAHTKDKS